MKLEQKFPQQRAFVSGAASGLGLAICERLAGKGWKLLIADINADRLAQADAKLQAMGATTLSMVIDVTDYAALEGAASALQENWGGVDLVFNNAGIAICGAMDELSLQDWEKTLNIDLWSVIYGCKIFTPMLKRQGGGYIINTASSAGTLAGPEMACYNVAKAGVVSLSETLNAELSKDNIGVSVICPTVFVTSLGDSLTGGRPMEQSLVRQLEKSRVSASDITDDVISAIEKNRLYVISQTDARWGWRMKRMFPELFARTISYLYRNKKWIYSE
jgi:NAD(P)-dependent dehydrogenase (short-subunit alcohol dehydrogenase family)